MGGIAVKIEKTMIHGWRGFRFEAGDVAMCVAPDIGGRIISLKHLGEELLFVDEKRRGETYDFIGIRDIRVKKREIGFGLWGGDKTWISPQKDWLEAIPPVELDAGKYAAEERDGAVIMTSSVCRETGLRVIRRVKMTDNGEILLGQTIRNEGYEDSMRGIWDVTQTLRPFDVYFPISKRRVRPYAEEGDSVDIYNDVVHDEYGWTRIECRKPAHFKFGGRAERGTVIALRNTGDETLVFARRFYTDPGDVYAHGASVEVYNSPKYDYLEIEVHAPLIALSPGGRISHEQVWRVARFEGEIGPNRAEAEIFR